MAPLIDHSTVGTSLATVRQWSTARTWLSARTRLHRALPGGDATWCANPPIALDYSLEMSQSAKGFSKDTVEAQSPCREMRGAGMFFAKNFIISVFIEQ